MAREKHLGLTVMYGSCCVSFFHRKPLVKSTFFSNPIPKKKGGESPKSRFRFDPKYPLRVWILWIHDPFLDFAKKTQNPFLIEESFFGFSQKNAP